MITKITQNKFVKRVPTSIPVRTDGPESDGPVIRCSQTGQADGRESEILTLSLELYKASQYDSSFIERLLYSLSIIVKYKTQKVPKTKN